MLEQLNVDIQRKIQSFEIPSDQKIQSVQVVANKKPNVKLPKFSLLIFSGEIDEWLNFKQIFVTTIHNKPSTSGIQKLQYLKFSRLKWYSETYQGFPSYWGKLPASLRNFDQSFKQQERVSILIVYSAI